MYFWSSIEGSIWLGKYWNSAVFGISDVHMVLRDVLMHCEVGVKPSDRLQVILCMPNWPYSACKWQQTGKKACWKGHRSVFFVLFSLHSLQEPHRVMFHPLSLQSFVWGFLLIIFFSIYFSGLSSFRRSPEKAFTSLVPLLKLAASHIPVDLHPVTNIYVLATAGMRLLKRTESTAIMSAVYNGIRQKYAFNVRQDHVKVISGQMEGVFGWIAVNYVLNRFSRVSEGTLEVHLWLRTDHFSAALSPTSMWPECYDLGGSVEHLQISLFYPRSLRYTYCSPWADEFGLRQWESLLAFGSCLLLNT